MATKEQLRQYHNSLIGKIRGHLKAGHVTNKELSDMYGIDTRTVRDIKSTIGKEEPIISLSSGKGAHISQELTEEELLLLEQQIRENKSRANEVLERNRPLELQRQKILQHLKEINDGR